MARSAGDPALALEMTAGIAYRLALPGPRHQELKGFRVLVIDTHPLLPTATTVRTALDRLAQRLVKAGVTVGRESPLLSDLADAARIYMRLLIPVFSAGWPLDRYKQAQAAAEALQGEDRSLAVERSRGAVLSHRDWLAADRARAGLQQRWRELFREWDVVLCLPMPTPAFPHDHSMPYSARHIAVDGNEYAYSDQLVWPELATTSGLPATAVPIDRSEAGLPIGVQIVGPYLEDHTRLPLPSSWNGNWAASFRPRAMPAERNPCSNRRSEARRFRQALAGALRVRRRRLRERSKATAAILSRRSLGACGSGLIRRPTGAAIQEVWHELA
jgi:amidase